MAHSTLATSMYMQVHVGDGLEAIAKAAKVSPGSLDLLVVDAGSGDASLAMSCPPAEFLKAEFLHQAREVLKPGGLMVINCVTRAESAFQSAVQAVRVRFSCSETHVHMQQAVADHLLRFLLGCRLSATVCMRWMWKTI